jgi:hypothetical protein
MAGAKVLPAVRATTPPHPLLVRLYIRKQGRLGIDHHLSEATGRNTGEQVTTVQAHGNLIERHEACAGDLVGNATRCGVVEEFDFRSRRGDFVFELRHCPGPHFILADIRPSGSGAKPRIVTLKSAPAISVVAIRPKHSSNREVASNPPPSRGARRRSRVAPNDPKFDQNPPNHQMWKICQPPTPKSKVTTPHSTPLTSQLTQTKLAVFSSGPAILNLIE